MPTHRRCHLGRQCPVHFTDNERVAQLLVNRAFTLIVDKQFSDDEQRAFLAVFRGER